MAAQIDTEAGSRSLWLYYAAQIVLGSEKARQAVQGMIFDSLFALSQPPDGMGTRQPSPMAAPRAEGGPEETAAPRTEGSAPEE